jgi:hypothetical protein
MFPLASVSRLALSPTQPPVQWVRGSFPMAKARAGRNADQSPPSSAEVKNEKELYFLPPWGLHDIAGRLYFTFYFLSFNSLWIDWHM